MGRRVDTFVHYCYCGHGPEREYPRCFSGVTDAYLRPGQIVVEDMVGVYHCIARCVRRAFLCGIDPYTGQDYTHRKEVEHYVMLLDWTGRELRADKRGAIPDLLAPIVERLGLNRSNWVETVRGFGRLFKQAAGRSSSLVDAAARRSRRWFQGKAAARTAFV